MASICLPSRTNRREACYLRFRRVTTATDLYAANDKLLKTRTTTDMLGRVVLSEQTEDGTNYTISARKAYDPVNRVTYSSAPMRSSGASTDS